ncbi:MULTISPECIES: excisionase family DNA-binding protein [Devosia]|uniref:excisionase family DNA-binding protein n=1 Tax=Devosia TaxID=46913 RepID=UPI000CE944F5|nr:MULTISPECIES: excisionase family DNA-binding protein [Devosia]AVF02909.1 DNA-binding protein [Devosia sp. I507]
MTVPANAMQIGRRMPSNDERAAANQLRKILAANAADGATLRVYDEEATKPADIVLTPGLTSLLMDLLRHVGKGDAVTLVPVSKMLTTQQSADILNVSRPFLVSLLERGEIGFETVGRHRRIRAENLFEYKRKRDLKRSEALSNLAAMDGEYL